MDRRSFLQLTTMLAAAHEIPGAALAAAGQIPRIVKVPHPLAWVEKGEPSQPTLTVVGIGGAGCNVVEHMIREEVTDVEFVFIDTGAQTVDRSSAGTVLQLDSRGDSLGRANDSADKLATNDRDRIADVLRGAHMAFIVAGMGGVTGTSIAPLVASIANELGIVTVATVFMPSEFEGKNRLRIAEEGIAKLVQHVSSPIAYSNNILINELGHYARLAEVFCQANDMVRIAISSIAHIVNTPGLVGVDFEDVRVVMTCKGSGVMGFATASGHDRACQATEQAMASPSLGRSNLSRATGILITITAGPSLKLKEVNDVMNTIRNSTREVVACIFGTIHDESMGNKMRVTVIATGIGAIATPFVT